MARKIPYGGVGQVGIPGISQVTVISFRGPVSASDRSAAHRIQAAEERARKYTGPTPVDRSPSRKGIAGTYYGLGNII